MTTWPTAELRRQVVERASNCCEYCLVHQDLACPSRKSEDMNILDFFLSCPHPGPVCFRSFYTLS
jgi:hypothetical protein